MTASKIVVGVIGGSGLYKLDNLSHIRSIEVDTPWGKPSSPIAIFALPSGEEIAFIARHGVNHQITPSTVPSRANIAAFKSLGIKAIVAFSAVGSLQEEIAPGDLVLPSQLIDRTKGIRPSTYFPDSIVAHAMFGDPFSTELIKLISPMVESVIPTLPEEVPRPKIHVNKTAVVMEGPQFSTRAESNMYRMLGGDIINMSALPEAKLAREAEISYALVCTATDYDAWRVTEEPVTVAEVIATLTRNVENSKKITSAILAEVHRAVASGALGDGEEGGMRYSVMTKPEAWPEEERKKLAFILPYIFDKQF